MHITKPNETKTKIQRLDHQNQQVGEEVSNIDCNCKCFNQHDCGGGYHEQVWEEAKDEGVYCGDEVVGARSHNLKSNNPHHL